MYTYGSYTAAESTPERDGVRRSNDDGGGVGDGIRDRYVVGHCYNRVHGIRYADADADD